MTELDEKIDKIVKDTFYAPVTGMRGICQKDIRDAIYLGIRAFAEQEPTKAMIVAGQDEHDNCIDSGYDSDSDGNTHQYTTISPDAPHRIYSAMLAEAIKSLPQ